MSYQIAHNPAFSPPTAEPKLAFLSSFYQTSDTESKHDEYVSDFFTPDATLIMGSKTAVGSDGILSLPFLPS